CVHPATCVAAPYLMRCHHRRQLAQWSKTALPARLAQESWGAPARPLVGGRCRVGPRSSPGPCRSFPDPFLAISRGCVHTIGAGTKVGPSRGNRRTMTATDRYLKDICELYIDSTLGYSDTAKRADDPRLQDVLADIGESRAGTIALLSATLEDSGVAPPRSGTFKGTMHRLWIASRDILSNTDDVNMVSECLRGESFLI